MQTYELTYIVTPEITSEEAMSTAKEIETFVAEKGGLVLKQLSPVAKTLSYPVDGRASGFMGVLEFQIEPDVLLEVKNFITKIKNILRHMIIIKGATELKKDKRSKDFFDRIENKPVLTQEKIAQTPAEKVELKDIDQKLEEILG